MSQFFYDFNTLQEGSHLMVQCLKRCYTQMINKKVLPDVKPGFLRKQLPDDPPQEGKDIADVIKETQDKIYPGLMLWQSPKYFGYFPSSIAVSDVFAEMFATTFHSPAFNFAVSPSHTQVENIAMDWVAKAFGLPEHFLLKNSGGGEVNNSATESVFISIHAAKHKKMQQLSIQPNDPRVLKLVAYYCQFAHNCAEKGLTMKQIFYRRAVGVYYSKEKRNYVLDIEELRRLLQKDTEDGLIPFWFGSTYGTTLSGAIDLSSELITLCKKYNIWLNVDAAYLGSAWICPQFRPDIQLLEAADSLEINFSKVLLIGPGGSCMFVKDKKNFTKSFQGTSKFCFYDNPYSEKPETVDYKDWHFGLDRRNNGLKFFFLFEHYGLKNIRKLVRETQQKAKKLEKIVQKDSEIFQIFCRVFGIICFQVKDKQGNVNEAITKRVIDRIRNIQEGFLSPGMFKGVNLIRFVVGNYQSDMKVITTYYEKIKQVAIEERQIEAQKRKIMNGNK